MALDIVPLQDAVLCAECEVISASASDECPACGSHSLLCLSRVLGSTVGHLRAVLLPMPERSVEPDTGIYFQVAA